MVKYILALLLVFLVVSSVASLHTVTSPSMEDTLLTGDRFIVLNCWYGLKLPFSETYLVRWRDPAPDDIIVFVHPIDTTQSLVKRVVAIGGQTVAIDAKQLYVDDREMPLPTSAKHGDPEVIPADDYGAGKRDFFPATELPSGEVFVLGDNRDFSVDSRIWGTVDENLIQGRAWLILFSLDGETPWSSPGEKFRTGRFLQRVGGG